ncbi:MAG: hypothetical protein M3Z74_00050 [Pseudomonadota bacterium]|nr:hypothetical protein [Pseudomonadota bacterium]
MTNSRRSYSSRRRLLASVKVAALLAALGFITVILEQPGLIASPSNSRTSIEQSMYQADSGGAVATRSVAEPAASESRLPTPDDLPTYFPGRFAPPAGEVELLPPTF